MMLNKSMKQIIKKKAHQHTNTNSKKEKKNYSIGVRHDRFQRGENATKEKEDCILKIMTVVPQKDMRFVPSLYA